MRATSLVLLLFGLQLAQASFPIILIPKIIPLETEERISVTSVSQVADDFDFEVRDSSVQSELFHRSTFSLQPNETKVLKFTLVKYPTFGKVVVSFTDHSSKKIKYNIVPVSKLNGITIVQTDKPIYTPKQEIKIRMLRLDKDFRPINDNLRLKIVNPQNIIMENIVFNKENQTSYFVDHFFFIPPAPIMGLWKAVVQQTPEHSYNATFEVQEYVLPTFTIDLKTNELILKSTKKLEGNVTVEYVYGKPVEGFVSFKFGYDLNNNLNSQVEFIGKSKIKDLRDGKSTFSFDIREFYIISPSNLFDSNKRFVVEVEVNEFVTGKKAKKLFSKGLFSSSAFKFAFDESINSFKPGLENSFSCRLLYANGKVASDVPVNVEIPEIDLVKRVNTNKDGFLNVSFIVESNLSQVRVELNTSDPAIAYSEQQSATRVLYKHQSPTGGYLSISKPTKRLQVGDQFETDFILNGLSHDQISSFNYYLVSPSGNLIDSKHAKYFEKIKFKLSAMHHPQVSLIVIAYPTRETLNNRSELKTNDILLTDTIYLTVDLPDDCGIKKRLFGESKQIVSNLGEVPVFKPGEKVSLEFTSAADQELSFVGVDEAVYALSSNTLLVKDKLTKIYEDNTLFCGKGGYTYSDVLLNSGLILFDPDAPINHNPVSSMCKGYVQSALNSKKLKDLKGSNRVKRSDDSQLDYNYLKDKDSKDCCRLGSKMSKLSADPKLCYDKLEILKKHVNSTKCIEAFKNCCFSSQVRNEKFRNENQKTFAISAVIIQNLGTNLPVLKNDFVHIAEDDEKEGAAYVREDFRETWLFDVFPMTKNKPTNLTLKLPDSITTQSLSTFALSREAGICFFQDRPIQLRTFKEVFLQVLMPYQAVQNEQLEMVITVFNYDSQDQPMIVYFYGVEGICSEADTDVKSERKSLAVPRFSSKSISIPLVPLKTGKFKIKIVAVGHSWTDVVIKELEVIPQGVTVEDDYNFQLDPTNKNKRTKRHISNDRFQDKIVPEEHSQFTKLKLSPNQKSKLIVPNSEQCIISAIADEYGPALAYSFPDAELATNEISKSGSGDGGSPASLDHLIKKPRGCGEQTAFYYAPTLYTLIYLESKNRLNADQKEKGLNFLRSGYKRQLMFRKSDGSFSAFPNRRSSIWLTSFIIKLFCVSTKYIELDQQVIKSGLNYLFKKQDVNGYWSEQNPVMHKQLIGGTSGRVPLTASVLGTLRTCSDIEQVHLDVNQQLVNSIQKAENFLTYYRDDVVQSKEAFKIALLAYSLIDSLSYREKALELLHHMASLANEDDNKVFWRDDFPIEVASYVLLTLAKIESQKLSLSPKLFVHNSKNSTLAKSTNDQLGRLLDDKKFIDKSDKLLKKLNPQSIVNYLNAQKTFAGGYDSTQDTILALNALSNHYRNQVNSEQLSMSLNCDISTLKSRFKRNLQFNNENALVMKRLQLDVEQLDQLWNEELMVKTQGNGLGVMMVKLKYNVILPEQLCKFDMNVELKEWRYTANKGSSSNKRGSHNVVEGKNNAPDLENEFEEALSNGEDQSDGDDLEKLFGKDLMDELEGDVTTVGRTRRSLPPETSKDERDEIKRKTKRETKKKDEKKLDKKFEKDFEKDFENLKAKDDEQEEVVLLKLEHHFETEEDNKMFKYEIDQKRREKRSLRSSLTRFVSGSKRKSDVSSRKAASGKAASSIAEENIRIISDSDNLVTPRNMLDDGSFATYRLKVCVQHIPNYDSEMTIIEVGLLTGFEVDKENLQQLVFDSKKVNQTNLKTQFSKVEFTARTVIMYLDSVPHGRPDCYTLKLYQTSQVANLQSGIVKVYDYYKKDDSCTTLYSPAIIEHLNITCENKACTCSVNNNCPDNKRIHDIIKISEHDYTLGKNKFQDLLCVDQKLGHVFTGRVVDYKLLHNNLLFKIESDKKYREKGPKISKTVVLVFNQECTGNLDMKVSNEPYLFFLNGTSYIAKGEHTEDILTIYPSRKSMIYSLSKNAGGQNNVVKYLDEIDRHIAKGFLSCQ